MEEKAPSAQTDRTRYASPARLLAVITVAVFAIEFSIMGLFALIPPLSFLPEALVDSSLLSLLIFPVLFITSFRPLLVQIEERRRAERALQDAYGELDARVRARTAELAQANEALRRERNFVDAVVDTAGALVVVLDPDGRIVRFNKACEKVSGYTFEEVRGRVLFPLLIPSEEVEAVAKTFACLQSRERPSEFENHWLARDGSPRLISWANTVIADENGSVRFVVGTGLDVTESRLAQEALRASEERNRTILRTAPDGFWLLDLEGRFVDVNDAYCRLSGYRREELLGMSIADLEAEESPDEIEDHIARVIASGHERFEARHRTQDGSLIDLEINVSYLPHDGGRFFTFLHNITQRKAADELIRASLQEKEILLKEIHHRVKNNLQIIASMLNLQAGRTTEEQAVEPLRESQNRIRTLALIHEKLYRSSDIARIPFSEYVRDLVHSLLSSFSPRHPQVAVDIDIDKVELGIDTAIPVALIINELVSNCVKHAFKPDAGGRISIELRSTGPARCLLVVADDGRGLPPDLDLHRNGSLGLQLVDVLATQLGGSVAATNDGGARVEIAFSGGK